MNEDLPYEMPNEALVTPVKSDTDVPPKAAPEFKRCGECFRSCPLTEFKQFQSSKKYAVMCTKCRLVKNKYMRERRSKLKEEGRIHTRPLAGIDGDVTRLVKVEDESTNKGGNPDDVTQLSASALFQKNTPLKVSTFEEMADILKSRTKEPGEVVSLQLECEVDTMAHLEKIDESTDEQVKEVVKISKEQMRDFVDKKLNVTPNKWGIYRLSTGGSAIYMTLYCSEDKSLLRPSVSTGMRQKQSKKTVDCKSRVHFTYNWSNRIMKISYIHINHPSDTDPDDDKQPSKPAKRAKRNRSSNKAEKVKGIGFELAEVDPTIAAIQARSQQEDQSPAKVQPQGQDQNEPEATSCMARNQAQTQIQSQVSSQVENHIETPTQNQTQLPAESHAQGQAEIEAQSKARGHPLQQFLKKILN